MQRVVVLGCAGAGKTTFSRHLGKLLDLPVFHLDRHYWRPGWVAAPEEKFHAAQRALVAKDRWVIDGNYSGSLHIRLPAADTIVLLDFPRWHCLYRVAKRTVQGWGKDGQATGCPERVDLEFLRWIWRWRRDSRPRALAKVAEHGRCARQLRLSNPREVKAFLENLR
ncbi:MAG TPA: DNA topology modulation protein FlaR [Amycolatopsis sp.]|uniref:DNA topology modulation protein FlaR n=1 Tax=Amycolatopsis sp. TaxID=37632 RepID=UPI002B484356|nr:DNA topology modulation protein FlaR [Amycolatopsis sp.]HKS46280.1 DNA topology modulation protein FlaR [Amycolatopsis sp.]